MRHYFFAFILAALPGIAHATSGTSIYVCAHPDDCILFMNPNLYNDIAGAADKVVTIYLTSGDAGLPFGQETTTASYPNVREQASLDATEWMADANKPTRSGQPDTQIVTVDGHSIERVSYATTVTYFLRLPDGNFDGNGFELYGHESLRKLQAGEIDRITPVDNEAAYQGWNDLVGVLAGIVTMETKGQAQVTLHIQDPDVKANPNDHSDHTVGASGVLEALAQSHGLCFTIYKHIDYSIAGKPLNLEGTALQNKAGSFAVLTATERHFLDRHDWNEGHTAYLGRNYYTTMTLPMGCLTATGQYHFD